MSHLLIRLPLLRVLHGELLQIKRLARHRRRLMLREAHESIPQTTLLPIRLHGRSGLNRRDLALLDLTLGLPNLGHADGDRGGHDLTVLRKHRHELRVVPVHRDGLDEAVRPARLVRALLAAHEVDDLDLEALDEHAVELGDGGVGGLGSLVVHVTVSLGQGRLGVRDDLAAKNVAKEAERVVQLLVVNVHGEVLDEDVANAGLAKGRIALGPHDAARPGLDHGIVHGIKRPLSIRDLVEVDVSVPEGTSRDSVTAYADGCDGSDGVEDLEEETLVDVGGEVADVEGGGVEVGGGTGGSGGLAGGGGRGGGGGG